MTLLYSTSMPILSYLLIYSLLVLCFFSATSDADNLYETLRMRPLADGKILSHFKFSITASDDAWEGLNASETVAVHQTTLLPRSLVAIIRTYDVEEVHLTLTSGRWNYQRWQDPSGHGAAGGGEIHAWISDYEHEPTDAVQKKWTGLTNTLGGLFCSSLNNLNEKITTSPVDTFFPSNTSSRRQPFFHGLLPLEHPCTENLTPFLTQLPCKGAAGLAQLLNPHTLFEANWQKLGLHVDRLPGNDLLRVVLELEIVQDPVRMTLTAGSQPRREWTFQSLFGRPITRACPVVTFSSIEIDLSHESPDSGYRLSPEPTISTSAKIPAYDVQQAALPLDLAMTWPVMSPEGFEYPRGFLPANVTIERIRTGYGLERAQLGVELVNNQLEPLQATWLEEWPWWIKVYMHTLSVQVDGKLLQSRDVVNTLRYTPAQSRGRPTVIEARVLLRPLSTTRIYVDVERAYLWYTDYPPDAMRGFDVPSAIVLVRGDDGQPTRRIYSSATLLDMPTPDFSMPYNVIILTSTIIALFFGSVFNLLTRTWLLVDMREPPSVDDAVDTEIASGKAEIKLPSG